MPTYNTTADWGVAQLRRVDWVSRHEMIQGVAIAKPRLYSDICKRMSPSELLDGIATGKRLCDGSTIVLMDKDRQTYRQTTLWRYFKRAVKKPAFKQLKLDMYFIKH